MATPKSPLELKVEAAVGRLARELDLPGSAVETLHRALTAEALLSAPDQSAPNQVVPHAYGGLVPVAAPLPMRSNTTMGLKPSAIERAGFVGADRKLSATERLTALVAIDAAKREAANRDPWLLPLSRLRGRIGSI